MRHPPVASLFLRWYDPGQVLWVYSQSPDRRHPSLTLCGEHRKRPRVLSLPVGLGIVAAGVLERLSQNPPVTRAMLGVLDHDDNIDPSPACELLGLTLTPLDEAIGRCIGADR